MTDPIDDGPAPFEPLVRRLVVDELCALRAGGEQARLGYGVVAMALPVGHGSPGLGPLTPLAARLLGELTIPLLLVRKAQNLEGKLPGPFSRVLVPVAGGRSARPGRPGGGLTAGGLVSPSGA